MKWKSAPQGTVTSLRAKRGDFLNMKSIASIILSLLLPVTLSAQSADSSKFSALGQKLAEYYDAIKRESLSVQEAECDFLIETATEPDIRQFIAQNIYDHYMASKMMGAENVAVHVFDKWFADGKLSMSSSEAFADAKVHADFNRQSLIGRRAPALQMEAQDGSLVDVFGSGANIGSVASVGSGAFGSGTSSAGSETSSVGSEASDERHSVLFFYDAGCPNCKLQMRLLNALFAAKDYPVDMYAVYVGDDRTKWKEYSAGEFPSSTADFKIQHLWDPDISSDFQRKYGVTKTPRMFLVNPDGIIIGRGLDAPALEIMLDGIYAPKEMVYGTRESEELFDGIFAAYDGKPSEGAVKGIADYVHDRALMAGDVKMFKQLAGDYLYYLSTRRREGFKEGMRYHIDKNILSQPEVWTSEDDSLKVVGFAQMMSELLSKALPGTKIPSVKVPGELYAWRQVRKQSGKDIAPKTVSRWLDKLKGEENIIIFYTEGCEICTAEKAAALELLSRASDPSLSRDERTKYMNQNVFMVNVDALMNDNPSLATRLMDLFDLSSLPYIISTDSDGIILRRYLSSLR